MNKALFALLIIALIVVYGAGQGWWGTPPADQGREPARAHEQINEEAVQLQPLDHK